MAVVVYQCDVCDRIIEIPENPSGLEVIQRCVITDNCRGKLFRINRKEDHIRGTFPESVAGLEDWSQRKVLHNHTQSIKKQVWTVNHNLGVLPSIQIFIERPVSTPFDPDVPCAARSTEDVTELFEVDPDDVTIRIISVNTFEVEFGVAESGIVQSVARSSSPTTTLPTTAPTEAEPIQLTASSELTLATLETNTNISLEITFITPEGVSVPLTYELDDQPALNSPWSDVNKVLIKGKIYTVRSFDFFTGVTEFSDGTIPEGSSFYLSRIDNDGGADSFVSIDPDKIIFLLANDPYENFDKVTNKIVDPTTVYSTTAVSSFFYNNVQLFTYNNLLENVYPHIRSV